VLAATAAVILALISVGIGTIAEQTPVHEGATLDALVGENDEAPATSATTSGSSIGATIGLRL
jgi:hypothetical protein